MSVMQLTYQPIRVGTLVSGPRRGPERDNHGDLRSIRAISSGELHLATGMDISDEGDHVYDAAGDRVEVRFTRPVQTEEDWIQRVSYWRSALESGGVALGAFDEERFAGLAVIRFDLAEGVAQLFALYVDRAHRRRGVGSELLKAAERLSADRGAGTLYVSAVPNASAIDFYLRAGFRFAPESDLPLQQPQDLRMLEPI